MKIHVFKRADGSEWADFRVPDGAKIIRTVSVETQADIDRAIRKEAGRVKALAERAHTERQSLPPDARPAERGWFARLIQRIRGIFRGR